MRYVLPLIVLAFASRSLAQEPQPAAVAPAPTTAIEGVTPSDNPELWVYLNEQRRYDDPKMILIRRAQQRTAERQFRLASQKWYGFSPLRPMATPIPQMGEAAPHWVGNGYHPYHWVHVPVRVYHIAR